MTHKSITKKLREIQSQRDEIVQQLESLQSSDRGQVSETRADDLDSLVDDFESAISEVNEIELHIE